MFSITKTLFSKRIIIFVAVMFLFMTSPAFASVVHLISGKIIQGEIVEQNDEFVRIDPGVGIPLTYYLDEIQTIDGQPVEIPKEEISQEEAETLEVVETPEAVEPPKTQEMTEPTATATKPQTIPPVEPTIVESSKIKTAVRIEEADKKEKIIPVSSTEDIATLDGIDLFKEQPSPLAVKPKEAPQPKVVVDAKRHVKSQPETKSDKDLSRSAKSVAAGKMRQMADLMNMVAGKTNQYFQSCISGFKDLGASIKSKWPSIKEQLYSIPVKTRRQVLGGILVALPVFYILVCFPLMRIARKLGRKHRWLIWVPLAQIFYFIHMAKRSLWVAVFFVIPILNIFLLLVLFIDILKLLRRPRWLIIFLIIPGLNIITLWYLAMSKTSEHIPGGRF